LKSFCAARSRQLNAKPLGGNHHAHRLENPVYPPIYRVIARVVRLVDMFAETAYGVVAYD